MLKMRKRSTHALNSESIEFLCVEREEKTETIYKMRLKKCGSMAKVIGMCAREDSA